MFLCCSHNHILYSVNLLHQIVFGKKKDYIDFGISFLNNLKICNDNHLEGIETHFGYALKMDENIRLPFRFIPIS